MRVISGVFAASLCAALVGCGGEKSEGYVPPKVGSEQSWKYVSEDGIEDDLVRVVATGPDFAIFQQLDGGEYSYFAEFSAIGFSSCEDDMPSFGDRRKAFSEWPLESGSSIEFNGADILIEKSGVHEMMPDDKDLPVFWIVEEQGGGEDEVIRFSVSPKYRTTVELEGDENSRDYAVSITERDVKIVEVQDGYEMTEGLDVTSLGNCANLLSETKKVTALEKAG